MYLPYNNFMNVFFLKIFKSFSKLHGKLVLSFSEMFLGGAFLQFSEMLRKAFSLVLKSFQLFLLFIAIDILIDYFFHTISAFHCTIINIFEIIINTVCDNTNFRLAINVICISSICVVIKNLLFIFLSWFEGLNFKSSSSLTLCCVEWVPEFISKACWKNRLVFLNLRILVFFSSKQDFVCCKFSFKRILDLQTKVLRVLWTIPIDFLAKTALQKAFKNFMKFKASLPAPMLFRWSPRFPRHERSVLLLSILSTSNSANNLFKLFNVSVVFLPIICSLNWLRNYSTLGIIDFDIQY